MEMEATSNEMAPEAPARHGKTWQAISAIGFVCAVIAWVAIVFNENVSTISAIVALVVSIVACIYVGKGLWRNLAITTIIASTVLLIVYALFVFGLDYLIASL